MMTPLIWVISGIVLLIVEVATPGFVIGFFGISACLVGGLVYLFPGMGEGWQWLLFSLFSIFSIVFLRKTMKRIFVGETDKNSVNPDDDITGKIVTVTETIRKDVGGRVDLFGVSWKAVADTDIPAGANVRVTGKQNLTLMVSELN
ncbi:MAG: NfeD family protein [Kiritimatiellae bacterium]|nr:NfeD family protein [Kiritimatiellia bacterium]